MKRSAVGFVKGSRLEDFVPVKQSDVTRALEAFEPGTKVVLVIKSYYRPAELSQKNVFHAYCTFISKETGQDRKEVDRWLRERYGLYTVKKDKFGEEVWTNGEKTFWMKPLSEYNTQEMGEFLDRIHGGLFDDFGLIYPEPKNYSKINHEI